MGLMRLLVSIFTWQVRDDRSKSTTSGRVVAIKGRNAQKVSSKIIRGRCWVVDGDTIRIGENAIRIAGIDAPELDEPWGLKAKWHLVGLCKGKEITVELRDDLSYDRMVGICRLPDGQDLAAEMVRAGHAIDWPRFSGGRYRHLEPPGIRKRLWRADRKQKGLPRS